MILVAGLLVSGVPSAFAAFHGIAMTKGCTSPVKIGDPYSCAVQILNVVDTAHDTLRVTGLSDTVNSAAGAVTTGNILPTTGLLFIAGSGGAPTCTGGSGAGTQASPYVGATECLLPFGSVIQTVQFSHYTVQPADFGLPENKLTDTATLNWNNTCVSNPDEDCTTDAQIFTAGSSALIEMVDANIQLTPPTATNRVGTNHVLTCHVNVNEGNGFANAPAATVCTVDILSGPGAPATQNCSTVGTTGDCQVTISSNVTGQTTLRASTTVDVRGVSLHRETGDEHAGDSPDATKTWVNARISIAPNATNEVGAPHTFTATLETDTGTGTFAAAAGEAMTITLTGANGAVPSPAGPFTCATNAAGQCAVTFTSAAAGTVTGHASSTLSVAGSAPFTVATDGVSPNSGDAVKTFVDANITVTPATAINPISKNHTLTGHVNVNTGSGGYVNAPDDTAISFSLTNAGAAAAAFVGPSSCTTSGGTGSCTVVISSSTTGTTTIRASTDVTVGGVKLHRETGDAKAGDSADALKLWADDTVRTDILRASTGEVVTTVVSGTVVRDRVTVAKAAGTPDSVPNPTGSVIFHRFATLDCTGTATNQTVALTVGSPSTAVSDDFAPTANISYQAEYLGDANYPGHLGACEPLTVTPVPAPAIAIVKNPKTQTVLVGGTATFTITVTNVGNTVLTNVTVTDALSPNCNRSQAQIPALASMDPGAAVTYTCTRPNVRRAFDNVAVATGTPPSGPNVTANDTAPVKTRVVLVKKKVKKKKPKVVVKKKPKVAG